MATFTFIDEFIANLGNNNVDLGADTFKAVLTNTSFDDAVVDELVDITQIANGNGYTTGGATLTTVSFSETGAGTGIWRFTSDDITWTATGGSIAAFQWIVIYSDTSTGDKLVGYWNFGTAVTITNGNTFTVDIGANGIFEVGVGTIS